MEAILLILIGIALCCADIWAELIVKFVVKRREQNELKKALDNGRRKVFNKETGEANGVHGSSNGWKGLFSRNDFE